MEEEQQFLWFSCLSNTWPTHLVYSQTEQYSTKVSRLLFLQSDYLHLVVRPRWRQGRTQLWRHIPTMHGDARELHEAGSVTRLWESCLHLYSLFSFSSTRRRSVWVRDAVWCSLIEVLGTAVCRRTESSATRCCVMTYSNDTLEEEANI